MITEKGYYTFCDGEPVTPAAEIPTVEADALAFAQKLSAERPSSTVEVVLRTVEGPGREWRQPIATFVGGVRQPRWAVRFVGALDELASQRFTEADMILMRSGSEIIEGQLYANQTVHVVIAGGATGEDAVAAVKAVLYGGADHTHWGVREATHDEATFLVASLPED